MQTKTKIERQLGIKHRIAGFSLPEIRAALEHAAVNYGEAIGFNGNKLKTGPMTTAVLLRWVTMPEAARARFLREGVAELERLQRLAKPDFSVGSGGSPRGDGAKAAK